MSHSGLMEAGLNMSNTINSIKELVSTLDNPLVVVEIPAYTQSAKAALAIGICIGCFRSCPWIPVEPSLLKMWSGSNKGDKKKKVREVVTERMGDGFRWLSNDNIVDAVGLSLAISDEIFKIQNDNN